MFGTKVSIVAALDGDRPLDHLCGMSAELVIPLVALAASLLTFLSGFGLGTLLMPVFAVFFPLEVAIALTAIVHLLNNLFKFGMLWRLVDRRVVLRFGLPAMVGAWLGAQQLAQWMELPPLYTGVNRPVGVTQLVIGLLMLLFAVLELIPASGKWSLPARFIPAGGALSGFLGGLSGHQGALRSIFLLRAGLGKESFIATGVAIALLVDITRIPVYLRNGSTFIGQEHLPLLGACVVAAFLGAWSGKRLLPKVTLRGVQWSVALLLFTIAGCLLTGVL